MSGRNPRSSNTSIIGHGWPRVKAISSKALIRMMLIAGISLRSYVVQAPCYNALRHGAPSGPALGQGYQ